MELLLLFALTLGVGALALVVLLRASQSSLNSSASALLLGFPLAGAFAVLPGFALYGLAGVLFPGLAARTGSLLFIWTINAPVEELAKYLCFVALTVVLRSLREPQDGALQGAATGLGFGLVENLLYGLTDGWQLLLLRSLVSLPGHVIYGAVWGGYHGFEVYQGRGRVVRWSVPLLALVPAIFAHALFNTWMVLEAPWSVALAGDVLSLGLGLFLFFQLRRHSPSHHRRPLRDWKLAIPETEHALELNPDSPELRRRLAAYLLVADRPRDALAVLSPLADEPWTQFYRGAAQRRLSAATGPAPPSASLDPRLFRLLSGA